MKEVIYDIETKTWAEDHPGSWDDIANFGLALAITWCECHGGFQDFTDAGELYNALLDHDRIITFNGIRFDNTVVAAAGRPREPLDERTLDILADLTARLGQRVKLEQLAEGTFYRRKSATGDKAVAWWKAYESLREADPAEALKYIQKIKYYCLSDVELTRDLYNHGLKHGHVWYTYKGTRWQVEVNWQPGAPEPAEVEILADPKGEEGVTV